MLRYIIRIILELLWKDWQYVGSFDTEEVKMEVHDSYSTQPVPVKVHCFESRWGTRHARITVMRHGWYSLFNFLHYSEVRKGKIWQEQVYPWLRGRKVSNIPSYKKVRGGKWDFKRMLKGIGFGPLNKEENS